MIKGMVYLRITLLCVLGYFTFLIPVDRRPILININGMTEPVGDKETCAKSSWLKTDEDTCECCLLEEQDADRSKSADEIIKACKDANLCTDAALSALRKRENVLKGSSEELLMALYNDAVVIRNMTIDASLLSNDGKFTETSLPLFLEQAYREKKLSDPNFSKAECLKAKSIGTGGGYNTLQLFMVTSTCTASQAVIYIMKEARDGLDEATKLKDIELLPKMKEIIAPNILPGLPSVSLPIAYFSYPDKTAIHYIATMPAAKGKALSDMITEFNKNKSAQNRETLNRAFVILGKEMANFYKRFMVPVRGKLIGKTMVHGDFHFFNLFFDEIGAHFTLIDNETMAKTMRNNDKVSPATDFVKLFFMPFSLNQDYKQFHDLVGDTDLKDWHEMTLKNFVKGYIQAYNAREQKQILEELKQLFNDPFTIAWVDFDDEQLAGIRTNYINPVFDELIKEVDSKKK